MPAKKRDTVRITMRFDPDVMDALRIEAEQDRRSVNSYVNLVLREHVERKIYQKGRSGAV